MNIPGNVSNVCGDIFMYCQDKPDDSYRELQRGEIIVTTAQATEAEKYGWKISKIYKQEGCVDLVSIHR